MHCLGTLIKKISIASFILSIVLSQNTFARPWSYGSGTTTNTRFFPTLKPLHAGTSLVVDSFSLPARLEGTLLAGDVLGNGKTQLVCAVNDPPSLLVHDLSTGESFTMLLEPNPYTESLDTEVAICIQLMDYDSIPGMEVFCQIADAQSDNRVTPRTLYQVVSPRQEKVLTSFNGIFGGDQTNDQEWNGTENGQYMFRSESGKWKMVAYMSAPHESYKPRSVNIYDVETGELETQFHMATPPTTGAMITLPDIGTYFFITPLTPDNWIKVNGETIYDEDGKVINVSETVDGILMKDREAYDFCLKYDDSAPNSDPLSLEWHYKRGELVTSSSIINEDASGHLVTIAISGGIRVWDPVTPGKIFVHDLKTSEKLNEFTFEEGLSYNGMMAPEKSDILYVKAQEIPRLMKYDLNQGLAASLDISDDLTDQFRMLGITDMDGDGEHDVIISRYTPDYPAILIFDTDLNEKETIPVPLGRIAVFADNDEDSFPELYFLDQVSNQTIYRIEYQTNISDFSPFEAYR